MTIIIWINIIICLLSSYEWLVLSVLVVVWLLSSLIIIVSASIVATLLQPLFSICIHIHKNDWYTSLSSLFLVKLKRSHTTKNPKKVAEVSGNPLVSDFSRLVNYYNLARFFCHLNLSNIFTLSSDVFFAKHPPLEASRTSLQACFSSAHGGKRKGRPRALVACSCSRGQTPQREFLEKNSDFSWGSGWFC